HFELETLAAMPVASLADAERAARALLARGPHLLLITSLALNSLSESEVAMLAVTAEAGYLVRTPRLALTANGAGDLPATPFLGHILRERDPAGARAATAGGVHAVLTATLHHANAELTIVAAQDALKNPPQTFPVERLF